MGLAALSLALASMCGFHALSNLEYGDKKSVSKLDNENMDSAFGCRDHLPTGRVTHVVV